MIKVSEFGNGQYNWLLNDQDFPYFAHLWLAEMVFPRKHLRVSTHQTAFGGVSWPHIQAFSILANEMVR